ncbi:hypothetical protein [Paludisphaera soli]|uniref:hypothetical protein n=1 Tax=Paludisphaera soli TaxID=2712865 RepID=UPI0013E9FD41|nr:hypothetical protein [Paludisphaera soli]
MIRPGGRALVAALLLVAHGPTALARQDDSPLGLSDLAAEHQALAGRADADAPARPATFRQLWERPDEFRGVRVRVAGRVVRIFRQDAVGSFPALVEAWIEQPPGDLLCLVFPAADRDPGVAKGAAVAFTGVYLRRVRYQADGDRLAPLIVGPAAPSVEERAAEDRPVVGRPGVSDWPGPVAIVGLCIGLALISGLLAWRSLAVPAGRDRRRGGRSAAPPGPAPEFLEPEADDGDRR